MKLQRVARLGRSVLVWVVWVVLLLSWIPAATAAPVPSASTAAASDTGAVIVQDLLEGSAGSEPHNLTPLGSTLFFVADDDDSGQEVWMLNPPYIQAVLVADILPGDNGSWPENLTVLGDQLFFTADDGQHGRELWVSEAPYTSARLVADINPGPADSLPEQLTPLGTTLFFSADDGSSGRELWKTQQPFNYVSQVADIFVGSPASKPDDLTRMGWNLFFTADDASGREVWLASPPSYNSVRRVTDINPGGNADPQELTPAGDILFFTAEDGTYGQEIWKSEPPYNPISTTPLNDFETRWEDSNPYDLYMLGDTLFFSANIGLIGVEPWKSVPPYDTTHTTRVADINEGFFQSSFPDQKTSIGEVLFFTATSPGDGFELWLSEPPYDDDSTYEVADIIEGPTGSDPQELTVVNNTLYFSATGNGDGREVWRTVPPYITAQQAADIQGGAGSSNPEYLTAMTPSIFLRANNGRSGQELWRVGPGLGIPATGFAPGRVTYVRPQPAEARYADYGQLVLTIADLNVRQEIIGIPALTTGWDLSWLGSEIGYLEGTAFPTRVGNTVLTGHAYLSDGQAGPFAQLEQLRWGDEITLDAWGQRFVYQVREVREVAPDDLSVFAHEDQDWLSLITCKHYDEESGIYLSRVLIRAVLVDVFSLI